MIRPAFRFLHDYQMMRQVAAHLAAVRARDVPGLIAAGRMTQAEGAAKLAVARRCAAIWAAVAAGQPIPPAADDDQAADHPPIDDYAIAIDLAQATNRPQEVLDRWRTQWGDDYPAALAALAWHAAPWDGSAPHAGMCSRIRMMHGLTQDFSTREALRAIAIAEPIKVAA